MFFHSLKTKIAVNFALLFLLAILLTDFVVVSIVEKHLILDRINQARYRLSAIAEQFPSRTSSGIADALPRYAVVYAHAVSGKKTEYAIGRRYADMGIDIRQLTAPVEKTKTLQVRYAGMTWGVFWQQKKYLILSDPLMVDNRAVGAGILVVDLDDIYQTLRKSQIKVAPFLFANLAVMLFMGLYRVSRLVFKPVQKIIRTTKGYSDAAPLYFFPQKRHHEFNQLSMALNQMIQRIEADREMLKKSLESLQAANVELHKAQNDIIRAEKLASVGRLAAGIAHEIGNPIGVVLGYLGLLRKNSISENDTVGKDFIDRSEAEINRINLIIRQLLDFSRAAPVQPARLSVNDIVKDVVDGMARHPIMANISITCRLDAPKDTVYGDAHQLRQVLLNLMINAADSIAASENHSKKGGEIRLATEQELPKSQKPRVKLVVADNGTGILKEDIDNIFDPFYTTKAPGKGTGLGLSVSYMIIEQMGGTISAKSEIGHGTAIIIELPLYQSEPADA